MERSRTRCFTECASCCNYKEPTRLVSVSPGRCVAMFCSRGGVEELVVKMTRPRTDGSKVKVKDEGKRNISRTLMFIASELDGD